MNDKDENLLPPLLIAICLAALGVVVLWWQTEVEELIRLEKLARLAKESTYAFPPSLVIPYSATVCTEDRKKTMRCRYYVAGTVREEIKR